MAGKKVQRNMILKSGKLIKTVASLFTIFSWFSRNTTVMQLLKAGLTQMTCLRLRNVALRRRLVCYVCS